MIDQCQYILSTIINLISPVKLENTYFIKEKKRNLSLNNFANRISVTPSFLMRLEKGEYKSIKLDTVFKIATGMQMSLLALLGKAGIIPSEKLPELEFYLREKFQFPRDAINDVNIVIQLLKQKYKNQIKNLKKQHQSYWKKLPTE